MIVGKIFLMSKDCRTRLVCYPEGGSQLERYDSKMGWLIADDAACTAANFSKIIADASYLLSNVRV